MVSCSLYVGLQSWSFVDNSPIKGGSACMYRPDRIMKAGGGVSGTQGAACEFNAVTDDVYVIKTTDDEEPHWTQVSDMPAPRIHFYLIPMPDGTVLAVGGLSQFRQIPNPNPPPAFLSYCDPQDAVLAADSCNPYTGTWSRLAAMSDPRLYHSSAVLLPDGSVFTAGGQLDSTHKQRTYQIFKPPYFFQPNRPVISAPADVNYGDTFIVTTTVDPATVTKVRLIRTGAATHSFDHSTRLLELDFSVVELAINVAAPAHSLLAPPGYYLLFVATGPNGSLPSEGKFIRIGS